MHNNIIEPTLEYDFSKVQLGIPVSHPNSTFVSRIFVNNKPLYIQTPKCTTKNGIIQSGKKWYCDLMFSSDDSIFIDWVTNLELKCQTLICSKSMSWFDTEYSKDDIENAFSSPLKIYKSGKYYLLRVNVKPTMKIYNEATSTVSFDDIKENVNMITVLEFYGIKFTSRNFQIEVELKQSLIVSNDEFVENCFIPRQQPVQNIPVVQQKEEPKYLPREPDEPPPPPLLSNINKKIDTPLTQLTPEQPHVNEEVSMEEVNSINEYLDLEDIKQEESLDLELSEFVFDAERLEETAPLQLKRPIDQYYREYNDLIEQANKLQKSLTKIYSVAKNLKEKHSLNVDDIEHYIYSDVDLSDNEYDDDV